MQWTDEAEAFWKVQVPSPVPLQTRLPVLLEGDVTPFFATSRAVVMAAN